MQDLEIRAHQTNCDKARRAIDDLVGGLQRYRIVLMFALREVQHRYRRTTLGMMWIVISMAVWVATISLVFTSLFVGVRVEIFVPYIAISIIIWGFFSNVVSDGCLCFVAGEEYILTDPIPLSVFAYRTFVYGLIVSSHNFVIFVLVAIYFHVPLSLQSLLFLPGLALFIGNCFWVILLLATVSTRFRDIPQLVANVLQILFYLTPIIWMATLLPESRRWLVQLNPLFHWFEIVRGPLLGTSPSVWSWCVAVFTLLCGSIVSFVIFARYRGRVAYWL
jgi:ABC-type polysaccharide/polyol phosphate export permease